MSVVEPRFYRSQRSRDVQFTRQVIIKPTMQHLIALECIVLETDEVTECFCQAIEQSSMYTINVRGWTFPEGMEKCVANALTKGTFPNSTALVVVE